MSRTAKGIPDPERGQAVAVELQKLGAKRALVRAAEQGYITELACAMPECYCPEELGGRTHFDLASSEREAWRPTVEHFPTPKRDGGRESVDNVILAHRLCNRIDYSIFIGKSHRRDLETIERSRAEAIRRSAPGGARES
jgi:hypothetical protein